MNNSSMTINRKAITTKLPMVRLAFAVCAMDCFMGYWMHKTQALLERMFT